MRKKTNADVMEFASRTAHLLDPDPAHSEHVTKLALALFDGVRACHGLGLDERRLLEIAGRLHDIGWSQAAATSGKHHKLSGKLIQKLDIPGLAKPDIVLCSLIARHHTKALPDARRHKLFASLDPDRREIVEWLAGILRVADALDCRHEKTARGLNCEMGRSSVKIHLEVEGGDCRIEVEKAVQKEALLVKKMKREIEYIC